MAGLLGWDRLLATLANPVVVACSGDAAESKERKEAVPLPLYAVARMEAAVLAALASGPQLDPPTLMCVVFLVMLWGALRFSDAQRVAVPEMDFDARYCALQMLEDKVLQGFYALGLPYGGYL